MQGSPYSILVVDDSESYRLLVRHYLKDMPFHIDEAYDGKEAVELFAEGRYDIILMDIIMPVMDGVEAITAIRSLEATQGIAPTPILSLSSEYAVATGVKCLQAGANRILIKPVSRRGLVATVCEMLGVDPESVPS